MKCETLLPLLIILIQLFTGMPALSLSLRTWYQTQLNLVESLLYHHTTDLRTTEDRIGQTARNGYLTGQITTDRTSHSRVRVTPLTFSMSDPPTLSELPTARNSVCQQRELPPRHTASVFRCVHPIFMHAIAVCATIFDLVG